MLKKVCELDTHGFAIDEQMNMNFVRDLAREHGKGFGGNLKLTLALSLGLISPREDAIVSLASGGHIGYTFAPGWDMPFDVPAEHIEQVLEAREWFDMHYTKYPESWWNIIS